MIVYEHTKEAQKTSVHTQREEGRERHSVREHLLLALALDRRDKLLESRGVVALGALNGQTKCAVHHLKHTTVGWSVSE